MKTNFKILAVLLGLIISLVIFSKQASAQESDVSFQVFYDELSPYGEWVDYPKYGYVWIPDAGQDFVPYSTEGQWVMTDYGWTWVSNYEWGWAPFHYGRWDYDNYYGWLWVPDYEWGPSWVTWVRADGYYGWQPMEPGISISLSFGRDYMTRNDHWTFVRDRDFERSDIQRYYVDRGDHDRIFRNSSVINNTYNDRRRNVTYISGPGREDVQRVTGKRVRTVAIQENNRPGQDLRNGRLRIFRPEIKRNNDNEKRPAPSRVVNLTDVKQPSERNRPNQPGNVNPSNKNRWNQQRNNVAPQNTNNNTVEPAQQRNVNQRDNIRSERPQRTVPPQNTDKNRVQPTQQRSFNPDGNNKREQQRKIETPQNSDINRVQPTQQRNVKPTVNNRRERQTNTAKPQNNKRTRQSKESKKE